MQKRTDSAEGPERDERAGSDETGLTDHEILATFTGRTPYDIFRQCLESPRIQGQGMSNQARGEVRESIRAAEMATMPLEVRVLGLLSVMHSLSTTTLNPDLQQSVALALMHWWNI
jgi:hypothetical protein